MRRGKCLVHVPSRAGVFTRSKYGILATVKTVRRINTYKEVLLVVSRCGCASS